MSILSDEERSHYRTVLRRVLDLRRKAAAGHKLSTAEEDALFLADFAQKVFGQLDLSTMGAQDDFVAIMGEPSSDPGDHDENCCPESGEENCPMCSGASCRRCGPDLWAKVLFGGPRCEHDVVERHESPHIELT